MIDKCRCGNKITQPPTGRRRTKCTECSPKDTRTRGSRTPTLPAPSLLVLPAPGAAAGPAEDSLEAATLAELDRAGRTASAAGRRALIAARLVDRGGYSAAGAAALIRAHTGALDKALEGAPAEPDALDEVGSTWASG